MNVTTINKIMNQMVDIEDSIVIEFKNYLKDILAEQYKCIVIFKIISEKLTEESLYTDKNKLEKLLKRINDYIFNSRFSKTATDNASIYYTLLTEFATEIDINPIKIYTIFKTVQNENMYDEISKRTKIMMGITEIHKNVRQRIHTQLDTQKMYGAKLVANVGKELTNTELTHNLANTQKMSKFKEYEAKLIAIVDMYNKMHDHNITTDKIKKAFDIWINVYDPSEIKKHIEYYIAYSLKLADPKIKNIELNTTLTNMNKQLKSIPDTIIRKYYSKFFNDRNKNNNTLENFDVYKKRHLNNIYGFVFDSTDIIKLLKEYAPDHKRKIPDKIINELELINNVDNLISELENKELITTYTKIGTNPDDPDSHIKLTKVLIKEMTKIPVK